MYIALECSKFFFFLCFNVKPENHVFVWALLIYKQITRPIIITIIINPITFWVPLLPLPSLDSEGRHRRVKNKMVLFFLFPMVTAISAG